MIPEWLEHAVIALVQGSDAMEYDHAFVATPKALNALTRNRRTVLRRSRSNLSKKGLHTAQTNLIMARIRNWKINWKIASSQRALRN